MTTGKTIALIRQTFVGKVMSLLFHMLPRMVVTFLPRMKCSYRHTKLRKWKWKSVSCASLPPHGLSAAAAKSLQLCPTVRPHRRQPTRLPRSLDCIVRGILQARMLEWVAFPFSRGYSQPRDWTQVSHTAGGFFTIWATDITDISFLRQ